MISHLKKVFSPDIGVEASSQVLDILEYACGLRLSFALIYNKNPNFEMAYRDKLVTARQRRVWATSDIVNYNSRDRAGSQRCVRMPVGFLHNDLLGMTA